MEYLSYLSVITSFILGGGITLFANWKLRRKSEKVDFADKAIAFMEKTNDGLMKRVNQMEAELKQLSKFKCEKIDCQTRIPQ
jgi:hypothetical protein